jgi:hypothetical protein
MKWDNKTIIIVILVIIGFIGSIFAIGNFAVTGGSSSYILDKPYNLLNAGEKCDSLVSEIYGRISCETVPNTYTGYSQADFSIEEKCRVLTLGGYVDAGAKIYYNYPECPGWAGTDGCKGVVSGFSCQNDALGKNLPMMKIGVDAQWEDYNELKLNDYLKTFDSNIPIKISLACGTYSPSISGLLKNYIPTCSVASGYPVKNKAIISVSAQSYANYLYSEGAVPQGKIVGSEPRCSLSSDTTKELIALQPKGDVKVQSISGIDFLSRGDSYSIVVGWQDLPLAGNLKNYNGQDAICVKTFNRAGGIFEVKYVDTYGGLRYCKKGSLIQSEGDDLCCEPEQCTGGKSCENFRCVTTNVVCPQGEETCDRYYTETSDEFWNKATQKFYITSKTCDVTAKCTKTTQKEVGCTRSYCDSLDTTNQDFYCPPDNSRCLEVSQTKDPCPTGECCLAGNPDYFEKSCQIGYTCCNADLGDDPLRGICKQGACLIEDEDCDDKKDNDNDGKIDLDDKDCQICVIDGTLYPYTPQECCNAQDNKVWFVETSGLFGLTKTESCVDCGIFKRFTDDRCGGDNKAIIFGILAGIGGLIATMMLLRKSSVGDNPALNFFFSLIVGAMVGIATYYIIVYVQKVWLWVVFGAVIVGIFLVVWKFVLKR